MESKILDFIHRRFPEDSNWLNGNCFLFAAMLQFAFGGEVVYDPIIGHAYCLIDNRLYDWHGSHKYDIDVVRWDWIKENDNSWHQRLLEDCIW